MTCTPSVRAFFVVTALALPMACSSSTSSPPPDASAPVDVAPMDTAPADVPPADTTPADVRMPRAPQPIYSPCSTNAECMEGLTCQTEGMTGTPGGICNRTCTSDNDCLLDSFGGRRAVDGYCNTNPTTRERFCQRTCINGLDCERDGFTCQTLNAGRFNQVRVCIPICTDSSCVDGTVCDHDTGRCRPMGFTPGPGRHVGETCTIATAMGSTPATQCLSGLCNAAALPDSMGNLIPTGFNGGQCIGYCILPSGYNPSDIWSDPALPQANCPSGSICLFNGSQARGDLGVCLDECMNNSDCRVDQGYYCRKSFTLTGGRQRTFTNGFCTLIDCANTMTPCPTGYMCRLQTSGTTRFGRCIPATTM